MISKLIENGFFKGLQQKVGKEKANEARWLFRTILADNKSLATDKPTEFNLIFSSMVLAAYRVLKKYEYTNWEEILRYSLIDRTKKKQQFFMKIYLLLDRNPFKRIVKISKVKQLKHYGNQNFTHEIVKDTEKSYHLHIKKCFFFDFFRSHNALEVMPMFCSMDDIWGDLLLPHKHGVSFTRPQLLSKGDSHCFFKFEQTNING
ncbi:L-2-amino-thiazoline-4-carboxylic acid hydrolase [Neobacillus sp. 114]|uniref:L-2-amino-thiazoline-4-carboxylic acid hydrolase n=1 Tax=Neobacillus sp. 114 TaxID=3048535 RepID=UPI0024C440A4|nr:L-2-amino-thiazoline-4-carboxylic acid hydrolase [Neobacillus sp. 114]